MAKNWIVDNPEDLDADPMPYSSAFYSHLASKRASVDPGLARAYRLVGEEVQLARKYKHFQQELKRTIFGCPCCRRLFNVHITERGKKQAAPLPPPSFQRSLAEHIRPAPACPDRRPACTGPQAPTAREATRPPLREKRHLASAGDVALPLRPPQLGAASARLPAPAFVRRQRYGKRGGVASRQGRSIICACRPPSLART